jgi:3-hydroxybutyryl-CoA dehydrogenase
MIEKIAVAGAGTMGSGIAFSAAQVNVAVTVFDVNEAALDRAKQSVEKNLNFLLSKNKISEDEAAKIRSKIQYANDIDFCVGEIIIEAIIENLEAKQQLLQKIADVNSPTCILASNTSSLSIEAIQENLPNPSRVAGIHFFNPAHIMKLVEVVKGKHTNDDCVNKLMMFCKQLGKTPVLCIDAPGFIVNRVARHFYLESLYLVEQGIAEPKQIDAAMEAAGFKMGPFKLMDMIGIDINAAVSASLYESFDKAIRFTPSNIQLQKLKEGNLGKKTGKGFYQY